MKTTGSKQPATNATGSQEPAENVTGSKRPSNGRRYRRQGANR